MISFSASLAPLLLLTLAPAQSGKREFLYETAPFPSCHASTLLEVPDGILAAWFGGTHENHPDVGIWVSRRTAKGWSVPVEVANGLPAEGSNAKRYPTWNPVLCRVPGKIVLFYKLGPAPDLWWGMRKESTDEGKSWSAAIRLPDGFLGPVKNKPITMPNGDLLCPSSTETPTEPDQWRIHFERVNAGLTSWTRTVPPEGTPPIDAIQPSILIGPNNRLTAIGRSRQKKVFTTQSTDGGNNWTPLALTNLPNPNSGTDAVTLKDGRHMIVYNPVEKGRSPLSVAVSTDTVNWKKFIDLETEPGEFSYPAIIQTSDGKIHVSYTWHRKKIAYVVLDENAGK